MSNRAHRETDRILAELEEDIALLFAVGLDELNFATLYIEGDYTQRQRLQNARRERNDLTDFIIALIVAGVINSASEINQKAREIYAVNYRSIAKKEGSGELQPRRLDEQRLQIDVAASVKKRMDNAVRRGYLPADIQGEIKKELRKWKNIAIRMARMQTTRIENVARLDALYELRRNGANVKKQWKAIIDKVTRQSHKRVDGEVRELEERFSNNLLYPGDPDAPPEEVQNCRCYLVVA